MIPARTARIAQRAFRHSLIALAVLLTACRGVEQQRLYRAGLEAQQRAEQALSTGDTAQALQHFRQAYVALVDSDHPEVWPEVLAGILLCEQAQEGIRVSEEGWQEMLTKTRASAAGHLQQVEHERARARRTRLLALGGLLFAALAAALTATAQRKRRLEAENDLLQARLELRERQEQLDALRDRASSPALALALRSYEQLCSRYDPDGDNAALLREFRQQLADLRDDAAFRQELETALADTDPGLPALVASLPGLKEEERRLLRYLVAGLPTYLIAAVLGKSRSAVNMQVSRLRARIDALAPEPRTRLRPYFDARHPGRPRQ